MDIKVKTVLSHFTKGGKPCYQLMAKEPKTMTQDEFIERFAQETGLTLAKARLANDVHGRIICEATLQNYRVNTGDLTSQLVILGSLDSASAQATKKDNPVRVSLTPIGRFRDGAKVLGEGDHVYLRLIDTDGTVLEDNSQDHRVTSSTDTEITSGDSGFWPDDSEYPDGEWDEEGRTIKLRVVKADGTAAERRVYLDD